MQNSNTEPVNTKQDTDYLDLSEARDLLDILYVINALLKNEGNISQAAEELDIGRRTLYDLMERHGISCTDGILSIKLTPSFSKLELQAPCLDKYLA